MSKSEISDDQIAEAEFNDSVERIKKEIPFVDIKPYSHNIITLVLESISQKFGDAKVNQVIKDLNLQRLGWRLIDL